MTVSLNSQTRVEFVHAFAVKVWVGNTSEGETVPILYGTIYNDLVLWYYLYLSLKDLHQFKKQYSAMWLHNSCRLKQISADSSLPADA